MNKRQGSSPAAISSIVVAIAPIKAVVMMVMVVVMIPAVPITGGNNNPRSSPIIAVMVVMVMVMMMVLYKELSHSDFRRASGFIDSPQLFHSIRNRLQQVGEGTGFQYF